MASDTLFRIHPVNAKEIPSHCPRRSLGISFAFLLHPWVHQCAFAIYKISKEKRFLCGRSLMSSIRLECTGIISHTFCSCCKEWNWPISESDTTVDAVLNLRGFRMCFAIACLGRCWAKDEPWLGQQIPENIGRRVSLISMVSKRSFKIRSRITLGQI